MLQSLQMRRSTRYAIDATLKSNLTFHCCILARHRLSSRIIDNPTLLRKNIDASQYCIQNRWQHTDATSGDMAAMQWLQEEYSVDANTAKAVIRAFPGTTSIGEMKSIGAVGMRAVIEAVQREQRLNPSQNESISIHMKIPHHHTQLDVDVTIGSSFYDLAKTNHDVSAYLECACSGNAACSTCHVIVAPQYATALPPPEEAELDMIDLAWGKQETSRLGCQIIFTKQLDGLVVTIPEQANNLY